MNRRIVAEVFSALLVSTMACSLAATIFNIPWVIGLVVGVLLAAWWMWKYLVLRPSALRSLVAEIKEMADSASTFVGRPDQAGVKELVLKIRNRLDTLKLSKEENRDAQAILEQIPPFFKNMTEAYMRFCFIVSSRVLGKYLDTHTDPKKQLQDKFWIGVIYLIVIWEYIKALTQREKG
ncbi:MAG: hypothetical protein Q7S01_03145 [bacterium]|nr:hypothetical protein [bacterium]